MAILYRPSLDPSRVYYGTDTRALELLAGAALAMVWPSRRLRRNVKPQARNLIDGMGVVGLVVIGLMFWQSSEFSPFLYRGGFALLSIATVLAVAALTHPASRLGPIVGCRPMRWIGQRSYGIYLWTLPIIVLTTPQGAHWPRPPARRSSRSPRSWRSPSSPGATSRTRSATAPWAGSWRRCESGALPPRAGAARGLGAGHGLRGRHRLRARRPRRASASPTRPTRSARRRSPRRSPRRTCSAARWRPPAKAVVHIGDSTSEGLVSEEYLPDPSQLISAQYARVGATTAAPRRLRRPLDLRELRRASPTPRKRPKPGRTKASKAAG